MNLWEHYKTKTRGLRAKTLAPAAPPAMMVAGQSSTPHATQPRRKAILLARGRPLPAADFASHSKTSLAAPAPTMTRHNKNNFVVEGRLDLHGMTGDEAFTALDGFFYHMRQGKKRHLLIITGKGKGVMKKTLGQFMERIMPLVASHGPAGRGHGGDGAYYIILKKSSLK